MSKKIPKLKNIQDDSQVKAIGNLYRLKEGSDWKIKIQLDPEQDKQNLGISQLPLLARRRTLNATRQAQPAGYKMSFILSDAIWQSKQLKVCPVPGIAQQKDRQQWCFHFQQDGIDVYLPQLELARCLFLYEPYLCRLAMIQGGIAEEFDVQDLDEPDNIQINLLESCSLPKHVRGDHELRRALASVILDPDIRASFESIARYQIEDGEDIGRHRVWQFRFDPPPLVGVTLTLRGHYDQKRSAIFVYEIYGLEGMYCNHAHHVHFYDPGFEQQVAGKGTTVSVRPDFMPEIEIDDDEIPAATKGKELVLESPQIIRSYLNPANTTRTGKDKKRPTGGRKDGDPEAQSPHEVLDVSNDEVSHKGHVLAGGLDGVNDQSDDAHHYAGRFQAFDAMVKVLESKGCKKISSETRKLPALKGRSKHLLANGDPRCWSIKKLFYDNSLFVLMEVDTQGSSSRLSTLLVKQPVGEFNWESVIPELEKRVVHDALKWPTKYLGKIFPAGSVQRISHPKTSSDNKDILETESILHWADRVLQKIQ